MCLGPSGDPRPDSVTIPNCSDDQDRCQISKSKLNKVYFNFTAPTQVEKMYGHCHVSIRGKWINIPTGKDGDVCANLVKGKCPLQAGDQASYSITQKLPFYTIVGIKAKVRIQAIDSNANVIGCIIIDVQIAK